MRLQFSTPERTYDLADDFDLATNPTPTGWQYSEAKANGGGPLARAIEARSERGVAALADRAWRVATGRHHTEDEAADALALMEAVAPGSAEEGVTQLCLALFNLQEFLYID